jgi:hypothetical protein
VAINYPKEDGCFDEQAENANALDHDYYCSGFYLVLVFDVRIRA